MIKRPAAILVFASAVLMSVPFACSPRSQYSAPLPLVQTEEVVNTMRMLVDSFTRLEGRRPISLDEACLRLRPSYASHGAPPRCAYWLHDGDTIPLDGWRNPLRYEVAGKTVRILSAAADRRMGTGDDMGFDSEQERARVAAAAGCYRSESGDWKEFPGDVLRLDTVYRAGGAYRAAPVIAPYFGPLWLPSPYPFGRDSVYVIWQAIHHGVHFHFRVYPDSMTGFVFGGPHRRPRVVVQRIACSP